MHRQKSILSFLQRPSPENQKPSGNTLDGQRLHPQFPPKQQNQTAVVANQPPAASTFGSSIEIDTPPEKVPRRVFPAGFAGNDHSGTSSMVSSIMHKFVKVDAAEKCVDRYLD